MLFVKLFHTQIRQMLSLQQHNKHAIKQHTVVISGCCTDLR